MTETKTYYSITEIAKILGISRVAVFNKIKAGKIKAIKIGRMYAIPQSEYSYVLGTILTDSQKKIITEGVKKTVREYGDVLKKLGQE